jgi:hypothetical protein
LVKGFSDEISHEGVMTSLQEREASQEVSTKLLELLEGCWYHLQDEYPADEIELKRVLVKCLVSNLFAIAGFSYQDPIAVTKMDQVMKILGYFNPEHH